MQRIQGDWFKERLRELRKSQAGLARHIEADKATINHMLAGSRRMQLEEVERIAGFLEVSVLEILRRAGLVVHGGQNVGGAIYEIAADAGSLEPTDEQMPAWVLPKKFLPSVELTDSRIVEVIGDSMAPHICSGDRVMVDTANVRPSPAGVFAIKDIFGGVVIKRIAPMMQSGPAMLRLTSDGEEDDTVADVPVDAVKILGRVIAVFHKY